MTAITHSSNGERINRPQNKVLELFIGRFSSQNNPLLQTFTQPQKLATSFSPDNTLSVLELTLQRQNSSSGTSVNNFAEAIAGLASQQEPQTSSATFTITATNEKFLTATTRNLNRSKTFFKLLLKWIVKEQKQRKKSFSFTSPERSTTNNLDHQCHQKTINPTRTR